MDSFHLAFAINLLKPYTTSINKKEDNGKPSLRPLEALKRPKGDPFMKEIKEVESGHPIVQLTI